MTRLDDSDCSIPRIALPFRPDIEGCRALAVTFVIVSHCGLPFLRSGFVGVDIFFVLSGFLITSLLLHEIPATGSIRLGWFYARRARRLLPAAMLLVLAVCLVEAAIASPILQARVLKAALAAVLYCSNIYFAHQGLNYFEQESAVNPLLHTWSLAVEEQFYLVWPVLLLALSRAGRKAGVIVLATIALVSFAFCVHLTAVNPPPAFFGAPARAWEFCSGALLAYLPAERLAQRKQFFSVLGALGLMALCACAQWTSPVIFPGYVAVFTVMGTGSVLLAGAAAPGSLVPRLLGTRPAVILGGLSYSLYLWHWPALVIAQQWFPAGRLRIKIAAIAVAVLLAVLVHYAVENPIRFHPSLSSRMGLTLFFAGLGAVVCVCALGGWQLALHRSRQFQKFDRALRDIPAIYGLGCVPQRPDPEAHLCSFGETQHPQSTVVLYGDSHAAEWFPALNDIAVAQHWKLVTIVKPGCTPLNLEEDISPPMERVCSRWRQLALVQVQRLKPDMVVISSASLHPVADGKMLSDPSLWQKAAHDTFIALATPTTQVRFIRDTPHAGYNVLECLAQAEWDGHTQCPAIIPAGALNPEIYATEVRASAGVANVGFIDLSDRMCNADQCFPEMDGTVVYRDFDHLTATFNRSMAPALLQQLRQSSP